jgi:DNA-binding beta-propeller fold protein YncE
MDAILLSLLLACHMPGPALAPGHLLRIEADPPDALISVDGYPARKGTWTGRVYSGQHYARLQREGFADRFEQVEVTSGRDLLVELEPLDHPVQIDSSPPALLRIQTHSGEDLRVQTPYEGELSAGPVRFTLWQEGHAPKTWTDFIDGGRSWRECLPHEGQLVDCHWRFPSGKAPKGLRFSPDGTELWVSLLKGPPSVEVYSAEDWSLQHSIPLGEHGAVELEFSPDGTKAYASQMQRSKVYELDASTKQELRSFASESAWTKVLEASPDGRMLYASNWVGDAISFIDLEKGKTVRTVRTADTPRGLYLTKNQRSLYVATYDAGDLQRIDVATGGIETVFDKGGHLRHIAADEERGRLYVSDMAKGRVFVHDIESGETRTLLRTESHPNTIVLSPDRRILFISCRGRNNPKSYYLPGPELGVVMIVDALDGRVLDVILGGNQPTGLDLSPDGRMLATSDFLDSWISVYAIPPTEDLLKSDGGRGTVYKKEMAKSEW